MPLYEITAPDGRTYEIEGPVGATQRQVEAEVLRQFPMAGKTTQELKDAPSAPSKLKDVGLAAKQGLAGGIQSLTNLFGVNNAASQYLGGVQQSAFEGLSPARKEEIARRQELIERSGGDVGSKVGSFLEAPLQTGVQALTGSIPIIAGSFIPGGQIAAGASLGARALAGARGAGGIGGLMGVGGQKGQDYEAVKQALLAQGESPEVAEQKAQEAAQFSLQNLPRQAVAGGAGALEGVFGIESILANAARKVSKGTGAPSLDAPTYKKAIGLSVLGESIPEAAQAAVGQVGTNVALNQAGISKDLTEGLAGTVAHDALVGAVLGLAVSPLQMSNLQREQKQAQAAEQAKKQAAFDKELKDLNDKAAAERAVLQKQTDEIQQRMGQTLALPAPAQILEPEEVTPPLQNPIGNLTPNELGPEVTQYINKYRKDNNLPLLQSYSIEDIKATMTAVNPEGEKAALDSILTAKTGYSGTETYTPENVIDAAVEKNVATDTKGFNDFLTRTTGVNNLEEMSQPQLYAAFKALKDLPANTTGEQIVLPTGSNSSSVPPAKTTLPEGYDIVEKQLKEGEVPESFAITPEGRGKPLTTVINQADVQEKIDRLTGLRQKEAAKTLNDITKYEATVKQGRSQLESMEARGETGTEGYAKAQARQERVEDVLGRRMKDLYDRIEGFSAPLQAKPVGKRNLARSGFTIVKDGKETATFPTRQAAEESILTELPDDVLESIVSSTKSGGFAQRAAAEQNRRTSPPKEGKKVSEVLRKIEEEKAKKLEPTPEAKAQMAEVEAKLKPILKQFGLGDVKLNLVDKLDAEGSYNNSLIEIALGEKNPVRVLRHESIHALKDLKFFSPEQWTALTRMAKDQWIDKYLKSRNADYKGQKMSRYDAYVDLYKGDMEKVTEEAIADAFADFDSSKAPPGMLAALLKRLNDFFVALRNALNDAGFQTFEDVFGQIERGELKAGAAAQGDKRLSVLPEKVSKIDPNDVGNVVKTSPYKDAGINVLNSQIAKTSKALEVDGVGKLFDEAYLAEFKKRGDWRNPNDFNRAVVQAVDELKFQLRQSKSGLDWYEEDIAEAFKLTQRYIPSLKKPEKRALFSVIAGIMSPSTNARDNWVIAAQAYQSYEKTGVLPGTNPATGGLWMGGLESANKKKQLDMLNAMLQPKSRGGLGEKATVEWLQGSHTVAEITDFRAKYGGMGKSNVGGKATDILPGFTAFGPKVGPFVMNINGIYEVTVDVWMTRTFNRYFGQMMGADGKIIRAPTEPQRVAIKNLAVQAAQQLGIKPYQVQSVLWFLEQQIFNKLGTGAKSYGFSDGAIKFIETQGGVGGAKVSAPDSGVNAVTDGATGKQAGQVSPSAGRLSARTTKQGVSDDTGKQLSLREPTARSGTGGGERLSITGAEEGQSEPSRDRERRDQVRGFTPLAGAPIISGATGPDPSLVKVAEDYAQKYKIPYRRQASYVEIDEDFASLVAQAYDAMPHAPQNPKVKEAYQDLNRQTRDQYDALVDAGYTFTFFDSNTDPYDGNPFNAMRDLRKNKQMAVYGTYDGYGTEGITGAAVEDNPMLEDTGLRWPDQNGVEHMVTANDLFRAVHDAFGHGLEGAGFRARGEENAWQAHARLFTGPAVGAITSETRGQNSWLNFGPYGEKNRTAKIEDTVFAEQKTGLMPDWTWNTNIVDDEGVVLGNKQADAVSVKGLHYGKARVEELDASKYGSGVRGAERRRLEQTDDDRIKQRVYFYIAKPDGSTPLPEAGVGQYVYTQKFDNVLGQGPTMSRLFREANGDSNAFESLVVDSGYDGYAVPNMGMMVILNHNTPVNYKGTRSELADDQKRLSLNEAAPNSLLTKRMSSIGIKSTDDFWKRIQNVMIGTGSRNPSLGAALDTTSTSDQVKQAIAVWKKDVDASGIQNYLQKFRIQGAVPEIDDLIAGPPSVKKMLLEAGIRPTLGNAISAYNSLPKSIADDAVNDMRYSLRTLTPDSTQEDVVSMLPATPMFRGVRGANTSNPVGAQYFSSSEVFAKTYSPSGKVDEHRVALQNPLVVSDADWSQYANSPFNPIEDIEAKVREGGHDGVVNIRKTPMGSMVTVLALDSETATNPDKRMSLREAPDTPEFKRFFAGSKVVDADGNPLVVYHGSNKNEQGKAFTQFDTYGANYGLMGQGSYFTDNPEIASSYAKKGKGDTPTVYPVYLSIQNPIDMDARGNEASWQEAFPDVDFNEYRPEGVKNEDYFRAIEEFITDQQMPKYEGSEIIQDGLRSMGYDGITHRGGARFKTAAGESNTRHQVFIAFDPEQIKSATGNIGTFDATSPDIRRSLRDSIDPDTLERVNETTTAREEKGYIERITDALGGKSYSTFRKEALNRYDYLSKMDKERAIKMGGTAFLADQSAEAAALNSDLAAGVTASVLGVHDRNGGIPVYKNGFTTTFNDDGKIKGPVAIFAPLATYNDPFVYQLYQFWAGAQRGSRLLASGKEELFQAGDLAKAKELCFVDAKGNVSGKYPEFAEIQKEWTKFNNGLVDFLVDTGVLSKAQKEEFIKYSDYIPFYRQMDGEKTIGPNIFQSISGVKAPKKLKGGEAPLADFLETIVRNTQSSIQMGMKNVAASRAIKNALEIEQAEKLPPNAKVHLDTVQVLENGNLVSYQAYDMAFVEALKSLNMPDLPFIGLLSGPANLLRNLVTKDPGFMLANMVRDSMAAYVTSGVKMTPILDTFKNFGSALAGTSPEFQALLNAGILGGYEFSQNIEVSGRAFEAELKKKASGKSLLQRIANPSTAATSLWEALEKGTTASDAATRIEVYKRVLAETNNEAEALYRALEVMNFNRKGSSPVVRILTAAIPFLNARMQGLDVLYRASFGELANKDAKAIQRAFFVRGMTMAALSCMYWALTHDEDEYKKQEQETKDNNWLIPSLGIKIPTPFEIGVIFKIIPERIMALTFGDDTGKDFMKSMARQLTSTLAVNPIPQAALPFVEAATNYSFFTQRPIVGQGMEGIQPEYQVGPGTSQVSANLGSALGISPMKLDHLIGGFTGTMGMYMVSAIDAILNANSDAPAASKRFEQLPIIRRFAIDPEARGTVTAYYELKNATDSIVRTSNLLERTMNFEERGEFLRDNIKMLASKEYILDLEKTMKEFRQMQVMIRSSNMDADAKREALLRINQAQNALTSNIQTLKANLS